MKTVIFIKDVIRNFELKAEFVGKLCEHLDNVKHSSITEKAYYPVDKPDASVVIGGCDAVGRCDDKELRRLSSNHEIVVMPCIGGPREWKVKQDLHNSEYNIIEFIPPRISGVSANQDIDILDFCAKAVADYIKLIVNENYVHDKNLKT